MNTLTRWSIVLVAGALAGCASPGKKSGPAAEKPVHERGWIGGAYKCAKSRPTLANWLFGGNHLIYCYPRQLEPTQKSAILVTALETNTPAYRAGIRSGDLILELDHASVTDLPAFWIKVHAARSGSALAARTWRQGELKDYSIGVGVEKFQYEGSVAMGLPGFWEPPHLVPTREKPTLSLIALGWQREDRPPLDFASPEQQYRQACDPQHKLKVHDGDWNCWLAIFRVAKGKTILDQQPPEPVETQASP